MHTIHAVFNVVLHDFPGISPEDRKAAEQRFKETIARELGGAHNVMPANDAYHWATEVSAVELPDERLALATAWAKAYPFARAMAFRGLGMPADAHFTMVPF